MIALARLPAALPDTVPFVGPEALERRLGRTFRARLGANESGFGPSPRAVAAMAEAARESWMYGDPEVLALREAIAAHHGVGADEIVVGEGIDGLLGLAVRLTVDPGTAVVTSLGGYPTFRFHAVGFGARLIEIPYAADREDLDGLLAAVRRERARLAYLANPDNPMGTWWPGAAVAEFAAALPEDCLLLLDEAYADTAPQNALPALVPLRPNVLRLRTFSKAHGLAGLRVGYAIGARETVKAFDRVRNHFGVGRIAQAGALAALEDGAHLAQTVERIAAARERIAGIAAENGLGALPSATNFVAIDCGADGAFAQRVLEGLLDQGVFVRKPMAGELARCIRVSTGPAGALDIFAEALPLAISSARR
jgi:histidinol-phosphate aminotransferase